MGLPVKFHNVFYYRIAGRYTFAGDLFITRGHLYYFPEVDLAEQVEKAGHVRAHEVGLLAQGVVYLSQRVGVYNSRVDFWHDGLSDEVFHKSAAAYIDDLKTRRQDQHEFGKSLPLPTHVHSEEISELKLSLSGNLSFFAQSDTHDFNVGLRRRKQLQNAVWEAGLGRV
jgi:hypothetical protein